MKEKENNKRISRKVMDDYHLMKVQKHAVTLSGGSAEIMFGQKGLQLCHDHSVVFSYSKQRLEVSL